jgi:hypothetical protein
MTSWNKCVTRSSTSQCLGSSGRQTAPWYPDALLCAHSCTTPGQVSSTQETHHLLGRVTWSSCCHMALRVALMPHTALFSQHEGPASCHGVAAKDSKAEMAGGAHSTLLFFPPSHVTFGQVCDPTEQKLHFLLYFADRHTSTTKF